MKSSSRIIKKDAGAERAQTFDSFFAGDHFAEVTDEQVRVRAEIAKMKKDAQTEAEKIVNEARKQAVIEQQSGFEEGIRRGLETILPLEAMLKKLVHEISEFKEYYPCHLEPEVVQMVRTISMKIIKDKLETDTDIVVRNVQSAFKELTDKEYIKIRVNAKDFQKLEEFKPNLIDSFHAIKSLEIVTDESVDIGGCIIETNEGTIDATIKNQMRKLHGLISCEAVATQMHIV
jgi:flagellar assembly protein FliH